MWLVLKPAVLAEEVVAVTLIIDSSGVAQSSVHDRKNKFSCLRLDSRVINSTSSPSSLQNDRSGKVLLVIAVDVAHNRV